MARRTWRDDPEIRRYFEANSRFHPDAPDRAHRYSVIPPRATRRIFAEDTEVLYRLMTDYIRDARRRADAATKGGAR